jgi:anti-sigma regulatory factor (Ser/Thr protein kinase)
MRPWRRLAAVSIHAGSNFSRWVASRLRARTTPSFAIDAPLARPGQTRLRVEAETVPLPAVARQRVGVGIGVSVAGEEAVTRLAATDQSVTVARHLAREVAAGLPTEMGQNLELVVSELATNAVRHARTPFRLSIHTAPTLRVEVTDGSSALPVGGTADPRSESGRGLWLVAALTRSWGVEPRGAGKVVWADLGPAP